ncbi:hypothetical protein ACTQ42_06510 [Streptococcus alactolyticus]|uniref:hypothetical protein n=1 Tax=Streptococcus alactolyticus TaxID=29389 RepID=UPI003F9B55C3
MSINPTFQKGNVHHSDVSFLRQISNGLPFLFVGHRIINGTLDSHFSRAVTAEIKMQFWCFPYLCRFTLNLISVCTAQYAESGQIFTMPFVGIRIILVLRLSFAVSTPDEILSLSTGDHALFFLIHPLILPHTTLTIPPSREGELEVWDEKKNWKMKDEKNKRRQLFTLLY